MLSSRIHFAWITTEVSFSVSVSEPFPAPGPPFFSAEVLPPFLIITIISFFYDAFADNFVVAQLLEGMQAGVGAVIASVVYDMAAGVVKGHSPFADLIMVVAFIVTCFFGVSVIDVVLVCIVLGIIRTLLLRKEAER